MYIFKQELQQETQKEISLHMHTAKYYFEHLVFEDNRETLKRVNKQSVYPTGYTYIFIPVFRCPFFY